MIEKLKKWYVNLGDFWGSVSIILLIPVLPLILLFCLCWMIYDTIRQDWL